MDAFKDLNNLYFFAKVVDCGSYTAAAEMLGMQTSKSGGRSVQGRRNSVRARSIEPVRQEEVMSHANSAASAAPT